MLNFFKNLGPVELIILAVILIALFGSKLFVSLGKTAGQSVKEIKNIKKPRKSTKYRYFANSNQ